MFSRGFIVPEVSTVVQLWMYGYVAHFPDIILLIVLFLYKTTLSRGDQGDTHVTLGCGKLISPAMSGLEWKG